MRKASLAGNGKLAWSSPLFVTKLNLTASGCPTFHLSHQAIQEVFAS
jgi:hypothetical protein